MRRSASPGTCRNCCSMRLATSRLAFDVVALRTEHRWARAGQSSESASRCRPAESRMWCREICGQAARAVANISGGGMMIFLQRHHHVGVARADGAVGHVHGVDLAVRHADVVEDVVDFRGGNRSCEWNSRRDRKGARSPRFACHFWPRTCRMNWPLSVFGKKSWPSHGTSRKALQARQIRKTGTNTLRCEIRSDEHSSIDLAKPFEACARSRAGRRRADYRCACGVMLRP